MTSKQLDFEEIQKVIEIADRYRLDELSVSQGALTITVKSEQPVPGVSAPRTKTEAVDARILKRPAKAEAKPKAKSPAKPKGVPLISPMTGVFYRSSAPDAPPFTEVGEHVAAGQTVGLIEAMKVFSEIPSEISGKVLEIVAGNGKLVQADEPLMFIEPDDGVQEAM